MTPFLNSIKVHVRTVGEHNDVATGVRDTRVHFLRLINSFPALLIIHSSCVRIKNQRKKSHCRCMDDSDGRLVRNQSYADVGGVNRLLAATGLIRGQIGAIAGISSVHGSSRVALVVGGDRMIEDSRVLTLEEEIVIGRRSSGRTPGPARIAHT